MINNDEQGHLSESEQYNIAMLKRFFREVWNERRTEIIPKWLAADVVYHSEHEKIIGIKRWKEVYYDYLIEAVPDLCVELEDIIAKDNYVFTRWTARGFHMGELFDVPPTKEKLHVNGMDWTRVVDGKAVEVWSNWNLSYFLRKVQKEVKALRGIIPFCSFCKKIRDDKGYWEKVDIYIRDYYEADISHGICPDCAQKNYPEFYESINKNEDKG